MKKRKSKTRPAMPIRYLEMRERGEDILEVFELHFFPQYEEMTSTRSTNAWPSLFASITDASAFLEDLGGEMGYCDAVLNYYNWYGMADMEFMNQSIAQDLEAEASEFFEQHQRCAVAVDVARGETDASGVTE